VDVHDELGHPVLDADNRHDEAEDAFPRHLDPAPAARDAADRRRVAYDDAREPSAPYGAAP